MISLCSFTWLACAAWVSLGGIFVSFPNYTPSLILQTYAYGNAVKTKTDFLLVPKRYFTHFYASGCICITSLFLLSVYVTCGGGELPYIVEQLITLLRYPVVESHSDMFSTLLVLACANVQVIRRLLECILVSIYSDSKMSITVYIVGVVFYGALPITTLAGTDLEDSFPCSDVLKQVNLWHVIGVALFIWSSWQQNRISVQFAKLRKNKSGEVENTAHHIPHGGLFEYVSCPHYFVEILIYFAFNVITRFQNTKLIWLFVFVLANQFLTGWFTHVWYKKAFKSYPRDRKAVIPYVL